MPPLPIMDYHSPSEPLSGTVTTFEVTQSGPWVGVRGRGLLQDRLDDSLEVDMMMSSHSDVSVCDGSNPNLSLSSGV